jgi:hypothetical protein
MLISNLYKKLEKLLTKKNLTKRIYDEKNLKI